MIEMENDTASVEIGEVEDAFHEAQWGMGIRLVKWYKGSLLASDAIFLGVSCLSDISKA